ncbi:membrane protein [Clostridium beijerinckii]|uniref:ABC transporter permease n=2 Tax=Clostridium beijerinckii TaxID=1520 RepID=A0AB74VCG5_CLOBE|nr:ABC transporter permease [Clostridium beijerinckii]NRZ28402.1 ABC-2 type transport system permease protein [Clostridium beijerinckii]NYB95821.1 ABC-2 type transport system permease protein [Clostridium beijerinckii]OOM20892.1 inner membrane transport permease YbhS [Clostridium beijerinckii]QUN34114.1 ABC transporter permease [Clostridium beijerinckii]SQB00963.1 multidrug ABC transporter permease [Clostridium beijerinckii]
MKEIVSKLKERFIKSKEIIVSVMLLLIIPAISSYALGYTYSEHVVENVPTMIVDHDDSTLSKNFITQINTNEVFNVVNYSENDNDIKNLMDEGKVVVGIIIPVNFSKDLNDGKAPKIMICYDGSQMSAVSAGKTRIAEILGTIKVSYLMKVGEGKLGIMPQEIKNNIIPIQTDSIFLGNSARSTANFLLQGMLIGIAQIGIISLGALVVKEKENYFFLLIKSIIFGLIGSISIFLLMFIQYKYFQMPYRGSVKAAIALTITFSITMINLGILFRLIIKNKLEAVSSSSLMASSFVLLSGYTFPLMAAPEVFKKLSKIIPFLYYGIPMRDLSLLGLNFNDIVPNLYYLIKYMIFTWIIMLVILLIKSILKKRTNIKEKILNKVIRRRKKDEVSEVSS